MAVSSLVLLMNARLVNEAMSTPRIALPVLGIPCLPAANDISTHTGAAIPFNGKQHG
jgi:hypothetical protein